LRILITRREIKREISRSGGASGEVGFAREAPGFIAAVGADGYSREQSRDPEKSQQVGLQMLRNFLEWAP